MAERRAAAILLAAGKGTRMKSDLPKVMHRLAGLPMIGHVLDNLTPLRCDPVVVVVAPGMEAVAKAVAPHRTAIQKEQLGTGHAALAARAALKGFDGDVLVLFGDAPFLSTETLEMLLARRRAKDNPAVVVLGMRPSDPARYGRLILNKDGTLKAIVEFYDATPAQRKITLCNSGVMAIDGRKLFGLLDQVKNDNAKGEYYLTDIVAIARKSGEICATIESTTGGMIGVDSRAELAEAESIIQNRLRARAMAEGATLVDPSSVFLSWDTRIGRDVVIGPNVVFGPGVEIADNAEIRPFCHIEGARIASGAVIGPFARLRSGSVIGESAHIGNFVETKNARIGKGAKANHLTYLGDAAVGAASNVGAGTITANYDGFGKYHTEIGANVSIGSNVVLRAPVTVGDGAIIGAGSVITHDVPANAMSLARAQQVDRPGHAEQYRAIKRAQKAADAADKATRRKDVKS